MQIPIKCHMMKGKKKLSKKNNTTNNTSSNLKVEPMIWKITLPWSQASKVPLGTSS